MAQKALRSTGIALIQLAERSAVRADERASRRKDWRHARAQRHADALERREEAVVSLYRGPRQW